MGETIPSASTASITSAPGGHYAATPALAVDAKARGAVPGLHVVNPELHGLADADPDASEDSHQGQARSGHGSRPWVGGAGSLDDPGQLHLLERLGLPIGTWAGAGVAT